MPVMLIDSFSVLLSSLSAARRGNSSRRGGGGKMSTRQSHSPSEDPVLPADSVKDKRNDMRITRNKKQELQRGEVPPPL